MSDTFLTIVNTIKRGDIREPNVLRSFVRAVVRQQVAAHDEIAVGSHCDEIASEVV